MFSWIEPSQGGVFALRYAVRHGATWSPATTIAAHRHFFHHPAEMPEVIALPGGHWFAHWVEAPEGGDSDAEYVYVSSSTDGTHWTMPLQAHHDHSAVQHGLASMIANPDGGASIFWLEALKGEDAPVSLKRTIVDATGKEVREEVIDSDVCGCCPTAVAKTSKGLLVAFRDHTKEDIRDIAVTRLENGHWSTPKIVNADNWEINACPTNAAAVAAKGDHVAVAWFTGAQDKPRELMAFSNDSGSSFSKPVTAQHRPRVRLHVAGAGRRWRRDRFLAGAGSGGRESAGSPREPLRRCRPRVSKWPRAGRWLWDIRSCFTTAATRSSPGAIPSISRRRALAKKH